MTLQARESLANRIFFERGGIAAESEENMKNQTMTTADAVATMTTADAVATMTTADAVATMNTADAVATMNTADAVAAMITEIDKDLTPLATDYTITDNDSFYDIAVKAETKDNGVFNAMLTTFQGYKSLHLASVHVAKCFVIAHFFSNFGEKVDAVVCIVLWNGGDNA